MEANYNFCEGTVQWRLWQVLLCVILMVKSSADDILKYFSFFFFGRKYALTFHSN